MQVNRVVVGCKAALQAPGPVQDRRIPVLLDTPTRSCPLASDAAGFPPGNRGLRLGLAP